MKVLLFLNGLFPKKLPKTDDYDLLFCTDGAYNNLKLNNITPHIISGDLDSIINIPSTIKIIETPNQNLTDFEKALNIIVDKGFKKVDIYGASGKEQDHFLGNINVAYKFENKLDLNFYDDNHHYFLTSKSISFKTEVGKTISLYPFPNATNIITSGLKYSVNKEDFKITDKIGIRNESVKQKISIDFESGTLIVFIEH